MSKMSDFVTAWRTNGPWLDSFIASATRELSKTGSLGCHAHVFRELATGLRPDEVVWLYAWLRESERSTREWQAEFLTLFPQVTPEDLPALSQEEDEAERKAEALHAAAIREREEYIREHGPLIWDEDSIPF
jgi:hypothetical protein